MLHHVAVLLFFLRTMLRMASHSKLLAWLFHKCLCHDIMQLFSFCGTGGSMAACSACTVVILHPTLLALSFSDLLAVLTLEVCKANPKIEDLAHQECKISKQDQKSSLYDSSTQVT